MNISKMNVVLFGDEAKVITDYQTKHGIKTFDEALGKLLIEYSGLVE